MSGRIYGYCRISTKKQKLQRQIDNIKSAFSNAVIITEEYTGTTLDRPSWNKLYKQLRTGDTVIFDEVSRMSRDAQEGFQLYQEMFSKGINLVFLKEPHISTDVYRQTLQNAVSMTGTDVDIILKAVNEYLMKLAERQIEIAFQTAQHEVEFLHRRTSEGVRKAQAEGKQVGRAVGDKIETKKAKAAKAVILKHNKSFGGSLDDRETMELAKVSRKTFYLYKKELKQKI